jgi:tetratricopeptide (TPR) repeat protein
VHKKYVSLILGIVSILASSSVLAETADSLTLMGLDRLAKGDINGAVTYYTKAIAADPSYPYSYINRSWAYNLLGRYSEAVTDATKAITLNPPMYLAYAYNNRAWALCSLGRFSEAVSDCNRAIAIDPGLVYAYNNRGWALCGLERYSEAIPDLDKAVAAKNNEFVSFSYFNRGWAYYGLKNNTKALSDFKKSCDLKNQLGCEAYDSLNEYVRSQGETVVKDARPPVGDCVFFTAPFDCTEDYTKTFTIPEGKKAVRFAFTVRPKWTSCMNLASRIEPVQIDSGVAQLASFDGGHLIWEIRTSKGDGRISYIEEDNKLELGPGKYYLFLSTGAGASAELCYELIPLTGRPVIPGEPEGPEKWDNLWKPPKSRVEER